MNGLLKKNFMRFGLFQVNSNNNNNNNNNNQDMQNNKNINVSSSIFPLYNVRVYTV